MSQRQNTISRLKLSTQDPPSLQTAAQLSSATLPGNFQGISNGKDNWMSELVWVCDQTRDFHGIPNARASRPEENFPSGSSPFPTCPSPPQPASVIGSSVIVSRAPNGILSGISVTGLLICSPRRQRAPDKECGVCAVRQKPSSVAIHHCVKHHCRQPLQAPSGWEFSAQE